ncbi:hypothetical protein J1614_006830 [Plenodomus biglobosus]|nr:hypothetical protein J1614_006830 [Plenodomus biglobosus]
MDTNLAKPIRHRSQYMRPNRAPDKHALPCRVIPPNEPRVADRQLSITRTAPIPNHPYPAGYLVHGGERATVDDSMLMFAIAPHTPVPTCSKNPLPSFPYQNVSNQN